MHRFRTGGVERVFINAARTLSAYHVRLIILNDDIDSIQAEIPPNVEICKLGGIRLVRWLTCLRRWPIFASLAAGLVLILQALVVRLSSRFEAAYTVNFSDTISTLLVASMGKGRKISWVHINPEMLVQSRYRRVYEFLYVRCYRIICICCDQRELLLSIMAGLVKDKIEVVYNSIDCCQIDNKKEQRIVFPYADFLLMVARLDLRSKDFFTVIRAFKELKHSGVYHKLVLLGDGPDKERIEEFVGSEGVSSEVIFAGNDSNPYKWMAKASAFIFSSRSEGFGMVLLEAMYCKVPVVATKCNVGPREITSDGRFGRLVRVGNHVEMKAALLDVLESRTTDSYLEKAKNRAREFDITKNSKLVEIFKKYA